MPVRKIGDWLIYPEANLLSKDGSDVRLEPRAMAVLCYLASKAGQPVDRRDLEENCWCGLVVGYDALTNAIIKIRKALGDSARESRYIETIPKFGYRLIAKVSGLEEQDDIDSPSNRISRSQSCVIAVLPFKDLSEDKSNAQYCELIADDIILDLSRIPEATVTSRNSSFLYNPETDSAKFAEELCVDFFITGSVLPRTRQTEVRAALNSRHSASVVWADRFSLESETGFGALDTVRCAIVDAVTLNLGLSLASRSYRGTENEVSYSHFLKGRELDRQDTPDTNTKARGQFHLALDYDACFSLACSYLSRNLAVCYINRWPGFHKDLLAESLELADRAVSLDEQNPHAHFARAASLLWMREHSAALASAEISLKIDPGFAEAHAVKGMILVYSDEPYLALSPLHRAMVIDPYFRDAYQHIVAQAYFHLRDFKRAAEILEHRLLRKPNSDTSRVLLAATHGFLGDKEYALKQWRRALEINPGYSL